MSKRSLVLSGLFLAIIVVVHLFYAGVVRPVAERTIEEARDAGLAAPRTVMIVLKDAEQEICIILALCCAVLMTDKVLSLQGQDHLFEVDLLESTASDHTPEFGRVALAHLEGLGVIRDAPLVRTLVESVRRFEATGDVHDAAHVVDTSIEATGLRLEAGNAMIRYMIWAIPSIGFVGTVRGIGAALAQADKALAGDIASMTASLGVAFNSTFVALMLSIGLTAVLYLLQSMQDQHLVEIKDYCDRHLVKRMARVTGDVRA